MLTIFIFSLLTHTALSLDIPCKEGVDIKTQPLDSIDYMVGNWSYIYKHFNYPQGEKLDLKLFNYSDDRVAKCPRYELKPISQDVLDAKKAQCGDAPKNFKWDEAKLVIDLSTTNETSTILIFVGKYGTAIMGPCGVIWNIDLEARKVSDSIWMAIDKQKNEVMMFSRQPIQYNDLKCVAGNIDFTRGMSGVYMCS